MKVTPTMYNHTVVHLRAIRDRVYLTSVGKRALHITAVMLEKPWMCARGGGGSEGAAFAVIRERMGLMYRRTSNVMI